MGCRNLPILFVMAMHVILNVACFTAPGPRLNEETAMVALRAFMDVSTILTPQVGYTEDMPARLDELVS